MNKHCYTNYDTSVNTCIPVKAKNADRGKEQKETDRIRHKTGVYSSQIPLQYRYNVQAVLPCLKMYAFIDERYFTSKLKLG